MLRDYAQLFALGLLGLNHVVWRIYPGYLEFKA